MDGALPADPPYVPGHPFTHSVRSVPRTATGRRLAALEYRPSDLRPRQARSRTSGAGMPDRPVPVQ